MKPQTYTLESLKRCTHRTNNIAWCQKLQKFCNAPHEYTKCATYQPKNKQSIFKGGY